MMRSSRRRMRNDRRFAGGLFALCLVLAAASALAFEPPPTAEVEKAWHSFASHLRFLELQDRFRHAPAGDWFRNLLPAWSPARSLDVSRSAAVPAAEPRESDLENNAGAALNELVRSLPAREIAGCDPTWKWLVDALRREAGNSSDVVPDWLLRSLDAVRLRLRFAGLHESVRGNMPAAADPQFEREITVLREEMAQTAPHGGAMPAPASSETAGDKATAGDEEAATKPVRDPNEPDIRRERFLWGVSTAGYQWEGANPQSIWAFHEARGKTEERSKKAANGLELFETDVALAASMGLTAFRTSIEWSRIEPVPGSFDPEGVAFYHRLFRCIRAHGMEPVVTLVHFSWPQWLEDAMGGWVTKRGQQAFRRYVEFVSREYADEVDWWLTFNEPMVCIGAGYVLGVNAPGYRNPILALRVSSAWIDCHRRAYAIIHANDAKAFVSFNNYTGTYQLAGVFEGHALESVGNPVAKRMRDVCEDLRQQWLELGRDAGRGQGRSRALDFIGVDYYCRWKIPGTFLPAHEWEVYPEGLYKVLRNYYAWFKVPVLIAENGMATRDLAPRADGWTREAYLVHHVNVMQRAIRDGIPVLGYIHWSITDNYEWGSFSPRFGLYTVDCRNQRFERVPTPSAEVFRKIVAAGGVTPELLQSHPAPVVATPGAEIGF